MNKTSTRKFSESVSLESEAFLLLASGERASDILHKDLVSTMTWCSHDRPIGSCQPCSFDSRKDH